MSVTLRIRGPGIVTRIKVRQSAWGVIAMAVGEWLYGFALAGMGTITSGAAGLALVLLGFFATTTAVDVKEK